MCPPTPALAKAGAAPGTTAGVELLLLRFPRSNLSCCQGHTSMAFLGLQVCRLLAPSNVDLACFILLCLHIALSC